MLKHTKLWWDLHKINSELLSYILSSCYCWKDFYRMWFLLFKNVLGYRKFRTPAAFWSDLSIFLPFEALPCILFIGAHTHTVWSAKTKCAYHSWLQVSREGSPLLSWLALRHLQKERERDVRVIVCVRARDASKHVCEQGRCSNKIEMPKRVIQMIYCSVNNATKAARTG